MTDLTSRRLLLASAIAAAVACATSQQNLEASASIEVIEDAPPMDAGAPGTPELSPPDEGFSIKFPGAPQPVMNSVELPKWGPVETAAWTSNVENVVYSISRSDYPEKLVMARSAQAFLKEIRDGTIAQLKGTLEHEQELTISEVHPGKEFSAVSDRGTLKARAYVVGARVYTLFVLYNPSIGAPSMEEFLTSLSLQDPPAPIYKGSGLDAGVMMDADGGVEEDPMAAPDAGAPEKPAAKKKKKKSKR